MGKAKVVGFSGGLNNTADTDASMELFGADVDDGSGVGFGNAHRSSASASATANGMEDISEGSGPGPTRDQVRQPLVARASAASAEEGWTESKGGDKRRERKSRATRSSTDLRAPAAAGAPDQKAGGTQKDKKQPNAPGDARGARAGGANAPGAGVAGTQRDGTKARGAPAAGSKWANSPNGALVSARVSAGIHAPEHGVGNANGGGRRGNGGASTRPSRLPQFPASSASPGIDDPAVSPESLYDLFVVVAKTNASPPSASTVFTSNAARAVNDLTFLNEIATLYVGARAGLHVTPLYAIVPLASSDSSATPIALRFASLAAATTALAALTANVPAGWKITSLVPTTAAGDGAGKRTAANASCTNFVVY